jgi:hypothetical protein
MVFSLDLLLVDAKVQQTRAKRNWSPARATRTKAGDKATDDAAWPGGGRDGGIRIEKSADK